MADVRWFGGTSLFLPFSLPSFLIFFDAFLFAGRDTSFFAMLEGPTE